MDVSSLGRAPSGYSMQRQVLCQTKESETHHQLLSRYAGCKRKAADAPSSSDSSFCTIATPQQESQPATTTCKIPKAIAQAVTRPLLETLVLHNALRRGTYYRGTSIPIDGWFHPCRICRCWTGHTVQLNAVVEVPCCDRCEPEFWKQEYRQHSLHSKASIATSTPSTRSAASIQAVANEASSPPNVPAAAEHATPSSKRCAGQKPSHLYRSTSDHASQPAMLHTRSVRRKLMPEVSHDSSQHSDASCTVTVSGGSHATTMLPLCKLLSASNKSVIRLTSGHHKFTPAASKQHDI